MAVYSAWCICFTSFSISFTLDGSPHDVSFTGIHAHYAISRFNICATLCPAGKGRTHRQKSFSIHSYAFSDFCWWGIRKSDHAWTCYWQILSNGWTETIRQLLGVLQRINENIYFIWHNSLHLFLQTIAVNLSILHSIHGAMFMYYFF